MKGVLCKLAETEKELQEAYLIRREIFVEEQKLFSETDRDTYDDQAIHIVALYHDKVIGTVRVYEKRKKIWYGSRLAVRKPYRGRVGKALVEKAIETVKVRGAKRFMAYVQLPNVPFFRRCRWKSVGDILRYHGVPHQLMEAELEERR